MYIINEMQTSKSGTALAPAVTRDDWQQAESEFHRLCSIAAVSSVPLHTIMMMDERGIVQRVEYYEHGGAEA